MVSVSGCAPAPDARSWLLAVARAAPSFRRSRKDCVESLVLKRANRVVTAGDFRSTVRTGRRVGTPHALLYVARRDDESPTRVGFIVAKSVGNAVTRNLVTRRLRSIGHDLVVARPRGVDLVIRALPRTDGVSWTTLQSEIVNGFERSAGKQ